MKRILSAVTFELVGPLEVEHVRPGIPAEYSHKLPPGTNPNRYAEGPFCRFMLRTSLRLEGVYAVFVEDTLCYIGECTDLGRRFGDSGYGYISPRNCHYDGQATNCKINANVLIAAKSGKVVTVWFHHTSDRKSIEARLISGLNPPWNGARPGATRPSRTTTMQHGPTVTWKAAFRQALRDMLFCAQSAGAKALRVNSGDLHRRVGGYPGPGHRMPVCCAVMRAEMLPGDAIVNEPPSGTGATLMIEYELPRAALPIE